MRYARNNDAVALTRADSDKRTHGRIRCRGIDCPLGLILDLSATGLRIQLGKRVKVREGEEVVLELSTVEGPQLMVLVVRWVKKFGRGNTQAGMEIVTASNAAKKALSELAVALIRSGMMASNFIGTDLAA